MKLTFLDRPGEGIYVIGQLHDNGRVSRIMAMDRTPELELLGRRMVHAYNACAKLSDKALSQLSEGGTSSGDLAERAVAWSLFMYVSRPTAIRILKKARDEIFKKGGVV